jgi:hypothetical protein
LARALTAVTAASLLDDEEDLLDAARDDDALPPQPLSMAKAVSAAVTPAARGRADLTNPTRLRIFLRTVY